MPPIAWLLFWVFGAKFSSLVASKFGSQILAKGDGKFTNVEAFIHHREMEVALLVTATCLLALLFGAFRKTSIRRFRNPTAWIVQGWGGFVCVNIFIAVAGHTVLFWGLLFTGKDHTHNYTQWRIKQALMRECEAPRQAVLMGASQTRAEIDTKVLNDRLGARLWFTELHFPGSSPYDMSLCLEKLPDVPIDYTVTYVSEATFYSKPYSERFMYFLGFRDLRSYFSMGPARPPVDSFFVCGLLGDIFPLYRAWEPLSGRIKGFGALNHAQEQRDKALEADLVKRARQNAVAYGFGPHSTLQKAMFVDFAEKCRQRRSRLVVCSGQLNPILGRVLDPALRADMMIFLREQARKDPNIVLLDEADLPKQSEADYDDLTHVNAAARRRFSERIAEVLQVLDSTKDIARPGRPG